MKPPELGQSVVPREGWDAQGVEKDGPGACGASPGEGVLTGELGSS